MLTAPQPPIVEGVSVRGNLVTLGWRPAAGAAADAHLIEVGDGPGRTTILTMLSRNRAETGLLPRGEYFLRGRALNAAGLSAPSADVWTAVTAAAPVAGVPAGFRASIAGRTVQLAWQRAPQGAAPRGYLLEVGTDYLSGAHMAFRRLRPSSCSSAHGCTRLHSRQRK